MTLCLRCRRISAVVLTVATITDQLTLINIDNIMKTNEGEDLRKYYFEINKVNQLVIGEYAKLITQIS